MTTPPSEAALESLRRSLGDRYRLERELGRGGMGAVYLARDLKLDRAVALKVLPPEFASQAGLRDRFLRETRTAASFSHPNIVPVYAVEEGDGHLAYAMGLVEGETLTERVARGGPLPVRELVRVIQDAAYALAYAHGRGVVHRDIKPDNIMVERATGRALVLDFGISRSMTHAVTTAAGLTRVGEVVGTPEYMSPEQATGDVVDGRSDLYSLGLVAWFAAVGRPAVTGDNTQKILTRQITEELASVAQLRPDLPRALSDAIDRCVRKDPAARFQSAEALVEEIDAAQLAEPEIPLAVRLLAGELGTFSMVVAGLLFAIWLVVRSQMRANMSDLDILIPVMGLLGVLIARTLTTMGEAHRLAESGFSTEEVMRGLSLVMQERSSRRAELRADGRTRRRRRAAVRWGLLALVTSVLMVVVAYHTRVRVGPRQYTTPPLGIVLVFTGLVLFGVSAVLVMKSPFRMTPGERLFRRVWLGPVGRAFLRLSMRRARPGDGIASASVPRRAPPVAIPTPGEHVAAPATATPVAAPPMTASPPDAFAALEARLRELERWREREG